MAKAIANDMIAPLVLLSVVALVLFYFGIQALRSGRILHKGKFVERKENPFHYWIMISVLAYVVAVLFFAIGIIIVPDLVKGFVP